MRLSHIPIFLGVYLAACTQASDFPNMQEGETARVVRIIDGDSFVLDGGQTVRLVGIEAPRLGRRGDADQAFAEESARMLESLVLGRMVQLYYPGPTRDRFDRALAHVMTRDQTGPKVWANLAMVDRGGAWVRLYPDTAAQVDLLLDAEQSARAAGQGLWSVAGYAPIDVQTLEDGEAARFRLIHAILGEVTQSTRIDNQRPLACARQLQGSPIQLQIRVGAETVCNLPEGTEVELRAFAPGNVLAITHPQHVLVLDVPTQDQVAERD